MKRFILSFAFCLICIGIKAQSLDVVYKPYGNGYSIAVIKPTIENFILLLSLNENQFEVKMKEYKYFEEESTGKYRSFWNGSLDNYAYAKCVNTFSYNVMRNEIRFMVSADMIYPSDIITQLYRNLKPYYKESASDLDGNSIDYFAFKVNDVAYKFYISNKETFYDVVVLKE